MSNIQRKTTYSGTRGSGRTTRLLSDVLDLSNEERSRAVVVGGCSYDKGRLVRHFEKLASKPVTTGLDEVVCGHYTDPNLKRPRFVSTYELNDMRGRDYRHIFVDDADRLSEQQLKEIRSCVPRWETWTETVEL